MQLVLSGDRGNWLIRLVQSVTILHKQKWLKKFIKVILWDGYSFHWYFIKKGEVRTR